MAAYATKADIDRIDKKIDDAVEEIAGIIRDFGQQVDERFNRIERGQDRLIETLDHFLKRLDDIEADNTARDAQLARLERWIEQVAKKTGVKLEY